MMADADHALPGSTFSPSRKGIDATPDAGALRVRQGLLRMTPSRHLTAARALFSVAVTVGACDALGSRTPARDTRAPAAEAEPPAPFLAATLRHPRFRWRSLETAHFRLYASEDSWAAGRLDSLGAVAKLERETVLAALGEPPDSADPRPHLFFLEGREDFHALVGQPAGGWTEAGANTLLLGASDSVSPPFRHELAHLYSHRRWGPPYGDWVSEGVAVFATRGCAGAPLHVWALAVGTGGASTPLHALESGFDFSRAAPHLEAGSFVEFLHERHGLPAVRALWVGGLAAAARATGESAATLEARWRDRVEEADTAAAATLDARRVVRCETGR